MLLAAKPWWIRTFKKKRSDLVRHWVLGFSSQIYLFCLKAKATTTLLEMYFLFSELQMAAEPVNAARQGSLAEGVVFWIYILWEQVIRADFYRIMNHRCLSACQGSEMKWCQNAWRICNGSVHQTLRQCSCQWLIQVIPLTMEHCANVKCKKEVNSTE